MHLAFNMFGLYSLGPIIVTIFGPVSFLALWVGSSLACDAATLYWDHAKQQAAKARMASSRWQRPEVLVETRSVGASGSILGMFAAFTCMAPNHQVTMFPIPFPMPAALAIGVFTVGSLYCLAEGLLPGIGHTGHLGGMVFGAAYYFTWGRRILRRTGRFG